jgi:hypothetical protein
MKPLAILALAAALSACAGIGGSGSVQAPPASAPSSVQTYLDWLEGAWSNQAQYDAAPDALKRAPAPGHPYDWLDVQYADFFIVEAPQLGPNVIYLEWRSGAADGPISRQRFWVFHEGLQGAPPGMDFYTLRDPEPFAGRGLEAGAFSSVTLDDLIGYPDGCTLGAGTAGPSRVVFSADPDSCVITARSGREMGIRARIDLGSQSLSYSEAGIMDGGPYAFLVPGGENLAYEFQRE